MEERIYTIPLNIKTPRRYRSKRAVAEIKKFVLRHMGKNQNLGVKIGPEVSEKIWERGVVKPPGKIRVRVRKDQDKIYVELPEMTAKPPEKTQAAEQGEEQREKNRDAS